MAKKKFLSRHDNGRHFPVIRTGSHPARIITQEQAKKLRPILKKYEKDTGMPVEEIASMSPIERKSFMWLHNWSWKESKTPRTIPKDVEAYLSQFKPTKEVTLYRHESYGYDWMRRAGVLRATGRGLFSFTHEKEGAQEIAESIGHRWFAKKFAPEDIVVDITMTPWYPKYFINEVITKRR